MERTVVVHQTHVLHLHILRVVCETYTQIKKLSTTCGVVPFIDSKIVVAGDSNDCWNRDGWMCVGRYVRNWRIGQEFHYHTDILLNRREHHWRLKAQTKHNTFKN